MNEWKKKIHENSLKNAENFKNSENFILFKFITNIFEENGQ